MWLLNCTTASRTRALASQPRTSWIRLALALVRFGLAPAMVEELYAILGELRDEGVTILLVDQMATMALSVADYAYVLEQGQVVAEGKASDLRQDERLIAAYLGGAEQGDKTPKDKKPEQGAHENA